MVWENTNLWTRTFFALNGSDFVFLIAFVDFHEKAAGHVSSFLILLVLIIKRTGASHYWSRWRSHWSLRCVHQLASHVCKPVFTCSFRLGLIHPDFMDQVKLRIPGRRWISSSHAANAFGFATLWHWSCGISCSAGQSFSWPFCLYGLDLGVHFISISCREPFRVCSSVIWSTGSGSFSQFLKLLPVQVNNGEPLYSSETYPSHRLCNICDDPDYYRFNVPLAFVCKMDTCRKAYLFIWIILLL